MLAYEVRTFALGGRSYLLLPKLVPAQVELISRRLEGLGFRVNSRGILSAKNEGKSVHVDSQGLCWSNVDVTDEVGPVVPELLSLPKQPASYGKVAGMYLNTVPHTLNRKVRFSLRVETGRNWRLLREHGFSGLSPDEHLVVSRVLALGGGRVQMVTDFPTADSRSRVIGKRLYYTSSLDAAEAVETLRMAGEEKRRNSYLPDDGILELESPISRALTAWEDAFHDLGEWCYFELR